MTTTLRQTQHIEATDARQLRQLLDDAYQGDFSDDDWHHAQGGVHVLATADERLVGHGALIRRRLRVNEQWLDSGYVEALAVDRSHRRLGIASSIMQHVEALIRASFKLGALSATDEALAFYAARGWLEWRGPTFVQTPEGLRRTPDDDGSVFVLPVIEVNVEGPIVCGQRPGDVW